jgi:hypothetical protein
MQQHEVHTLISQRRSGRAAVSLLLLPVGWLCPKTKGTEAEVLGFELCVVATHVHAPPPGGEKRIIGD